MLPTLREREKEKRAEHAIVNSSRAARGKVYVFPRCKAVGRRENGRRGAEGWWWGEEEKKGLEKGPRQGKSKPARPELRSLTGNVTPFVGRTSGMSDSDVARQRG